MDSLIYPFARAFDMPYYAASEILAIFVIIPTILLSLVGTFLLLFLIVPERRREKLGKFGRVLHDFFNMKFLIIEKILQFFYILSTVFSIALGVVLFLVSLLSLFTGYAYFSFGTLFATVVLIPFFFIVLGPVLIRLGYELTMMGIILVKNVIQINKKLKDQNKEEAAPAPKKAAPKVEAVVKEPAPAGVIPDDEPTVRIPIVEEAPAPAEEAPAPAPVANKFCRNCGTPTEDGICPKCGK